MTDTQPDPIPGIFPSGAVHILGGSPQAGKSTVLAQLSAALLTGGQWLGFQCNRTPLYYIQTDRSRRSSNFWLSRLPPEERPPVLTLGSNRDFRALRAEITTSRTPRLTGIDEWRYVLDKLEPKPGSVLIVDTFANSLSGDPHHTQSVRTHMTIIGGEAEDLGLTVIGSVYGVKITSGISARYARLTDRIIGAVTLRGGAATICYLTTAVESGLGSNIQEFEIVPREGRSMTLTLLRNDSSGFFGVTKVEDSADVEGRRNTNKKQVLAHMLDEYPNTFTAPALLEWSKEVGLTISSGNMRLILFRLLDDDAIDRVERGVYRAKLRD